MLLRKPLVLLFALLMIPFATWAQDPKQDPKQQLNDQFWEAVRKGDLPAISDGLVIVRGVHHLFAFGDAPPAKTAKK